MSYLDLHLSIGRDGKFRTSLYNFNFHITNFPFFGINTPSSPAYGVLSDPVRHGLLLLCINNDTLHWSDITPMFDHVSDLDLITCTEFDFLPLPARRFHRTYATGLACQQRTLTSPDTLPCPTYGLAYVLMLRPISPELVLFPEFSVSNIPRYFFFTSLYFHKINTLNTLNEEPWRLES